MKALQDFADERHEGRGFPDIWCQWVPGDDGTVIMWNGGEKFRLYREWLSYLIDHFLKPWGYVLNGEVAYRGEEFGDQGVIRVDDNHVV